MKNTRDVEARSVYLYWLRVDLHAGFHNEFGTMVRFDLEQHL